MSDSPCDRAIWAVNHMGVRRGDENRSTSARDVHHFCQRPLRLLKMLKKPLGSYDIKRPLGEPDITLVKVPWLLLPGSFVCNKNDLLLNLVEALLCSIHDQCKSSPQSVQCLCGHILHPLKQRDSIVEAAGSYNAALDLIHTALRRDPRG